MYTISELKESIIDSISKIKGYNKDKEMYTYGELRIFTINILATIINISSGSKIISDELVEKIEKRNFKNLEDIYPLCIDVDEIHLIVASDILIELNDISFTPYLSSSDYNKIIKSCTKSSDLRLCIMDTLYELFAK